jgi:hypothetical protein
LAARTSGPTSVVDAARRGQYGIKSSERRSARLKGGSPRSNNCRGNAVGMFNRSERRNRWYLRCLRNERICSELDRSADRAIVVAGTARRRESICLDSRAGDRGYIVRVMNADQMHVTERQRQLQRQRSKRQPAPYFRTQGNHRILRDKSAASETTSGLHGCKDYKL